MLRNPKTTVLISTLLVLMLLPSTRGLGENAVAKAQGGIRFQSASVTSRFPEEILFHVDAQSDAAEIVTLELSYRVSGSPYTRSRWPDFDAAQRVEVTYRLDAQIEHYSPGTEFQYYWTAVDAAGNVAESSEQSFLYLDDRFDWQDLPTEKVAVYWYEGEQSFGQELLDTALRALDRLEREAGVEADRLIKIYVYANSRDFRGALEPNAPQWIGGQALPALALIVAHISPSPEDSSEILRMIPHELSHVVLYQATHNPYTNNPNWLEEGIAVHNQEVADADFAYILDRAAREGELIPLRALSASFPSDTDLALLSYAESASVIEFILDQYGEQGLSALVDVFAEGETSEAAVPLALGITLDELEASWRETLPAAERTPAAVVTPRPGRESGNLWDDWMRLIATGVACGVGLSFLVVVAVVLLLMRRRRAERVDQSTRE